MAKWTLGKPKTSGYHVFAYLVDGVLYTGNKRIHYSHKTGKVGDYDTCELPDRIVVLPDVWADLVVAYKAVPPLTDAWYKHLGGSYAT